MKQNVKAYFEFVRYSLDAKAEMPKGVADMNWQGLFQFAKKQAILGVVFEGVKRMQDVGCLMSDVGCEREKEEGRSKRAEVRGLKEDVGCLMSDVGCEREEGCVRIPYRVLMEWIAVSAQIEHQNKVVNAAAAEVTRKLKDRGFDSCILKGQGNALMYDVGGKREEGRRKTAERGKKEDDSWKPFIRQPGDIDVWVRGDVGCLMSDVRCKREEGRCKREDVREKKEDGIKEVIKFVKGMYPKARAVYHHIDAGEINGVEVEVHYRPSFMNSPIHNSRLQRWFASHSEEQFANVVDLPEGAGKIAVPKTDFNIVFQLSHVYNHLLHEGIGLRQIVDYYYLLKEEGRGKKADVYDTLRYLGMEKIAGAMMWVLNEVLGLEEKYLIAPKNERMGRVLLSEIIRGGNFGHYDEEKRWLKEEGIGKMLGVQLKKNILRLKRDMRMMRYFPSECLWEPVFRMWHFFWRLRYN